MIYSFCRSHDNYLRDFDYPETREECREALRKRFGDDIIFLGYYQHTGCVWFVEGEGGPGTECRWDGVQFAGVWVPSRAQRCKATKISKRSDTDRDEYLRLAAREDCEILTDRWNGEED